MEEKLIISKNKVLVVEGKDEQEFFEVLLKKINLSEYIQIVSLAGKDKYKSQIPVLLKQINSNDSIELETFAIIRDADNSDVDNVFKGIKNLLGKENLPIPDNLNLFSANIPGKPRTGIFIMPDNNSNGMLEDLCLKSVEKHPVMNCVKSFIDCALKVNNTPKNTAISKAKVKSFLLTQPVIAKTQAFLAIQNKPVNSIGLAARKGYWNFDDPAFKDIISFLENM